MIDRLKLSSIAGAGTAVLSVDRCSVWCDTGAVFTQLLLIQIPALISFPEVRAYNFTDNQAFSPQRCIVAPGNTANDWPDVIE